MSVNPYESPGPLAFISEPETPDEASILPGEYRIKNGRIYIVGDVELPAVCIHSGATDNLVARQATVWFLSAAEELVQVLVGIAVSAGAAPFVFLSLWLAERSGFAHPLESVLAIAAFCLLAVAVATHRQERLFGMPVKITWFESSARQHTRIRLRRWANVAIAALALAAFVVWRYYGNPILFPFTVIAVVLKIVIVLPLSTRQRNGTYLIQGLPTQFLQNRHACWGASDYRVPGRFAK